MTETNHIDLIKREGEYVDGIDGLDASQVFLELKDGFGFRKFLLDLIRQGKLTKENPLELVFLMEDLGSTEPEKKSKLRFFKALLEDRKFRGFISEIKVKGKEGGQMIEPNVFASGVKFEILE